MGLTLYEASKLNSGDVHRAAIIELFARSTPLMGVLPFDDITGGGLTYNQEQALPGIAFRGINEGYTASAGVINPVSEPLLVGGGDLDVDKAIIKTRGIGVRSTHEAMKVKAMGQKIAHTFIKGDGLTDPREPTGLQARLIGSQVLSNSGAAGGGPLSMEKVNEAIDNTEDATHIIATKRARRVMSKAAKETSISGEIQFDTDDFGIQFARYNGLPIVEVDGFGVASQYVALGDNEAATGGGAAQATSIYVVSFREGMLGGIQNGIMEARDLGEIDEKPVLRTRVEWLVGFALYHPRAATRLRDIDAGQAAVA